MISVSQYKAKDSYMIDAGDHWDAYWQSGKLDCYRDELIEAYTPFCESFACKICKKLPQEYAFDQAMSDAYVALIESIPLYELGHDACFETFIGRRIFGGIMDSLRRQDILSRRSRDGGQSIVQLRHHVMVDEHTAFSDVYQEEIWEYLETILTLDEQSLLWQACRNRVRHSELKKQFCLKGDELINALDHVTYKARTALIEANY
jgi:DNA-directed RNA polymerase specialized sigma subunit